MKRVKRPRMSFAERAELWRRFRQGESPATIARALLRTAPGVRAAIIREGGIAPVPRRRAARTLQSAEREEISRGLAAGESLRQIARQLGRPPSTISREVARHGGRRRYRAALADRRAWARSCRPKRCRLATSPVLRRLVARKLALAWSPAQLAESHLSERS